MSASLSVGSQVPTSHLSRRITLPPVMPVRAPETSAQRLDAQAPAGAAAPSAGQFNPPRYPADSRWLELSDGAQIVWPLPPQRPPTVAQFTTAQVRNGATTAPVSGKAGDLIVVRLPRGSLDSASHSAGLVARTTEGRFMFVAQIGARRVDDVKHLRGRLVDPRIQRDALLTQQQYVRLEGSKVKDSEVYGIAIAQTDFQNLTFEIDPTFKPPSTRAPRAEVAAKPATPPGIYDSAPLLRITPIGGRKVSTPMDAPPHRLIELPPHDKRGRSVTPPISAKAGDVFVVELPRQFTIGSTTVTTTTRALASARSGDFSMHVQRPSRDDVDGSPLAASDLTPLKGGGKRQRVDSYAGGQPAFAVIYANTDLSDLKLEVSPLRSRVQDVATAAA